MATDDDANDDDDGNGNTDMDSNVVLHTFKVFNSMMTTSLIMRTLPLNQQNYVPS